ncbi:MAG: TonB family protein, partial [Saprospiraceae bacterium]|nr:TonB family protein [Pyrinomonadaceae bacterium]
SAVDPATRMGCIVTVGQVSAVLLLVFGLGLACILYTYRGGSYETASGGPEVYDPSINPPTTAANANTTFANVSANRISAKPAPSATGDPPKTISGGVVNSKAVTLPQPSYPPAARAVSASGSVNVQVLIDENGKVVSANAVSGHPLLRGAAVEAARSATFKPTLLSGRPVKVSGVITYNFVP